ncbi:MAG: 2-C-methyl-D-erythritol 2,4-cyclodiphosphate synthase [Peptococcaceae bacterium]|jgi:2-C-methyl-D-erythritol 2,4-cyclodiphosphate synthase|nr:2-C-methyl-D-erythritol 2,4-cyclodiphosphate synthase [Peptococcaceae bacterium]
MRVGFGYDVHKLMPDRQLVLGGVRIPFEKGLLGHSDADVLVHAIMDALLGAAGEGDIGRHFPDHDMRYKDISSLALLAKVGELLQSRGFKVGNIDSLVVAQRPKLAPYMEEMKHNIATALEISPGAVNVKATTTEGLGFAGAGEGMAAYAAALLE